MLPASRLEDNLSLDADAALYTWDPTLHAAAQQEGGDLTVAQRLFWTNILICNSLIVEKDPATGRYKYQVRSTRRRELSGAAACLASPSHSRVLATVPLHVPGSPGSQPSGCGWDQRWHGCACV